MHLISQRVLSSFFKCKSWADLNGVRVNVSQPNKLKRNLNGSWDWCVCPVRGEWDVLVTKVSRSQGCYYDMKTILKVKKRSDLFTTMHVIYGACGRSRWVLSCPASALLRASLTSGAAQSPVDPSSVQIWPHFSVLPKWRLGTSSMLEIGLNVGLEWRWGSRSLLWPLLQPPVSLIFSFPIPLTVSRAICVCVCCTLVSKQGLLPPGQRREFLQCLLVEESV